MQQIIFVHGMFQNPRSWEKWVSFFAGRGYDCIAPAWPLHEGDPAALRANPPAGLGDLTLEQVTASIEAQVLQLDNPIMIGHSVGGLITQIMLCRGHLAAGVAISSVAPNGMIDLDWSFLKNAATIANPLKGSEMFEMDEATFHGAFANTLSEDQAAIEFARTATHDSRNVLRGCMGEDGKVHMDKPHRPLLLIGGEKDQIIPAHLNQKNAQAYEDKGSVIAFREFTNRSHYICGEPGWEEVALFTADWLDRTLGTSAATARPGEIRPSI